MSISNSKGFTLVELLVIVGILVILVTIALPTLRYFQKESDLANLAEEIINMLRLAQNKTLASEGASQWGVYFNNTTSPHQSTLFKGKDYVSREVSFDEIQTIPISIEISEINLAGGNEVVFDRVTGTTSQTGNISLRLKTDLTKTKTIYIENSGQVGETLPSVPPNGRVKDSRHIHFDYSRAIETTTEKLILTFEGNIIKEIIITDNLKDGQIYWEGEVEVGGEIQKLKIQTHRLNNPDSQFSILRDRRYNNKASTLAISGDTSGNLIEYSADGLVTTSSSIYVGDLQWQ